MARRSVRSTPVLELTALDAGDALCAMTELDRVARNGGGGVIKSLTVVDKDSEGANLKVWLFTTDVADVALDAPLDFADSDLALYFVGVIDIPSAGYVQIADNGAQTITNINLGFKLPSLSHKLYYQLEAVATPDYTAADDLTLIFDIDAE